MKLIAVLGLLVGSFLISCTSQVDNLGIKTMPQLAGMEYYNEKNILEFKDVISFDNESSKYSSLSFSTEEINASVNISVRQNRDTTFFTYNWQESYTEELILINADNKLQKLMGHIIESDEVLNKLQEFQYDDNGNLQSIIYRDASSLFDVYLTDSLVYTYDAKGKNVIKVENYSINDERELFLLSTENYTYDNKHSPLKGAFYFANTWAATKYYAAYFSDNNIITWKTTGGPFAQESKYQPSYDVNNLITGYKGETKLIQEGITTTFSIKYLYQ